MCVSCSRRAFLGSGIGAVGSSVLPTKLYSQLSHTVKPIREDGNVRYALTNKNNPIVARYAIFGDNDSRQSINVVKAATNHCIKLFAQKEVWTESLRKAGWFSMVGKRNSPNAPILKNYQIFRSWVMNVQYPGMMALARKFAHGTGFPKLHIYLSNLNQNVSGMVQGTQSGRVMHYKRRAAIGIEGGTQYVPYGVSTNAFNKNSKYIHIHLNRNLLRDPRYHNPGTWVGVIAHEILHVMGHTHIRNGKTDYTDNPFIESFEAECTTRSQNVSLQGLNLTSANVPKVRSLPNCGAK